MTRTRHLYAKKLQRTVRWFLAKRRRARLQETSRELHSASALHELQDCAAARIQKNWKMHKEKTQSYHLIFAPTEARKKAATMFQRLWRKYHADERVRRLLLARQAHQQAAINDEHYAAYVIQLQSFVRQRVIAPNRIRRRKEGIRTDAATRIQSLVRGVMARQRVARIRHRHHLRADERFSEDEVHFFAIRIQKCFRGYQQRKIFRVVHQAAITIAYAFRRFVAMRKAQRRRNERKDAMDSALERERNFSARTIQYMWRYKKQRRLRAGDRSQ